MTMMIMMMIATAKSLNPANTGIIPRNVLAPLILIMMMMIMMMMMMIIKRI